MDRHTFAAYTTAVRHTFGRDTGIAAIVDTHGPGTDARAPYIGHLDPAGSAVCVVAADVGDPVHVVEVYGYRRATAFGGVTYARVGGGTQHPDMAAGVRAMADAAVAADLDYVTGF